MLELINTISDYNTLFECLHGFKDRMWKVVIV